MNIPNMEQADSALSADDLILFARVVQAGSFSKAAAQVRMPKSTLSRRITQLEGHLGERLLTRSTRRLTITEFGEHILDHAKRLLEETEAAQSLALHRQITPQGTLRVSLPPEFRELSLCQVVQRYTEAHPLVRLELDLSARRVDLIAERFDLAVRIADRLPPDSSLIARRIIKLPNGLYASPAYLDAHGVPTSPAELAMHRGLTLIGSGGDPVQWKLSHGAERWTGMPATVVTSNSLGFLQALALDDMGIVALSQRFARNYVETGQLTRILPTWELPANIVWCVMPDRRLLAQRTRGFIDIFREVLQAE